jgi:hypothetical protein
MSSEKESGIQSAKAFKQRSVMGTLLKILLVVVVFIALGLGVTAIFFKDVWRDGRTWVSGQVEVVRIRLFRHLSSKFISESDLKEDDKSSWLGLVDRMSSDMLDVRGSDKERAALWEYFDKIAEAMKDDELRSSELEPLKTGLVEILDSIDKTEKVKPEAEEPAGAGSG